MGGVWKKVALDVQML